MKLSPFRILLALNVLLIAGLAALWVDQTGKLRNATWVAPVALPPTTAVAFNPRQTTILADNPTQYMAILERPVFAPDRKPPPPANAPPSDPIDSVTLLGLVSGENASVLARVEGRALRVRLNELLGPWTLKGVEGRDATFAQGEQTKVLHLNYSRLDVAGVATYVPSANANQPKPVMRGSVVMPPDHRDILKQRNAIRAERGLPLIPE